MNFIDEYLNRRNSLAPIQQAAIQRLESLTDIIVEIDYSETPPSQDQIDLIVDKALDSIAPEVEQAQAEVDKWGTGYSIVQFATEKFVARQLNK